MAWNNYLPDKLLSVFYCSSEVSTCPEISQVMSILRCSSGFGLWTELENGFHFWTKLMVMKTTQEVACFLPVYSVANPIRFSEVALQVEHYKSLSLVLQTFSYDWDKVWSVLQLGCENLGHGFSGYAQVSPWPVTLLPIIKRMLLSGLYIKWRMGFQTGQ